MLDNLNSNQTKPSSVDISNQNKQSNKKSFFHQVADFFRLLGILSILLLLATSSLFAFLVINPEHPTSKWIVTNTPINRILGLNTTKTTDNNSTGTAINDILGLNNDSNSKYSFVPETSAKSTVAVVNDVLPSVVSIIVRSKSPSALSSSVAGTGYLVDTQGLVVTNKHVIADTCGVTNANIVAITNDQKVVTLTLLSVDPINDIAILKMNNAPDNLVPVKLADSNLLQLGAEVIAVGNALGELDNTVTKGIVSGLNRDLSYPDLDGCTGKKVNTDGLIQTDAAINKGNSGGPLFDSSGRLVGMNTFGTVEGENIGLAIPSTVIQSALESYSKNGTITRARLGVATQSINPAIKQTLDLPLDYGELIYTGTAIPSVTPGSAAEKASLAEGDIILEFNSQKLSSLPNNSSPLKRLLLNVQPNTKVTLTVLKAKTRNGDKFTYKEASEKIDVTLGGISVDLSNPQK